MAESARLACDDTAVRADAEAQYKLGLVLREGDGGPQDMEGARRQFHLAAKQGHAEAQVSLGAMLREGVGGTRIAL